MHVAGEIRECKNKKVIESYFGRKVTVYTEKFKEGDIEGKAMECCLP